MNFSAQKYTSHATAVVIDYVIIIRRRRVYCASTLLGRCVCKRVDVYIITLSCTWRIYALSERLLVVHCHIWLLHNSDIIGVVNVLLSEGSLPVSM